MYARFILIADSAHNDQQGKLHISGIFENIYSQKYPCRHNSLTVITGIECTKDEIKSMEPIIFKYRDDHGKVLKNFEIHVPKIDGKNIKDKIYRFNIFLQIEDMLIKSPGQYEIALFIDDRYIDSATFNALEIHSFDSGAFA